MFYKTISYFKFLLKSTNQHGVHSPFVYNFVTKGLYKKENTIVDFKEYSALKNLSKKEQKVLSKVIRYFKIDEFKFELKTSKNSLDKNHKLFFINQIESLIDFNFTTLNSKQIIVVHGIHQQKETTLRWQEIIKNKEATVTIDLYYFGIIFIRKKQAKEHFILRI
ncbi:MAG: hypothetical protein NWQ31_10960 [Polaribacter sp.]|nr:hypothetical protein [Polaribacter sp.]